MECDGSCMFATDVLELPCEDGEELILYRCHHEGCYILATYAPPDPQTQKEEAK
jgi:hypothetical protein